MDNIYFLWLQKIATKSNKFNIKFFEENFSIEMVNNIFNGYRNIDENLLNTIDSSILNLLLDKNIIKETKILYKKLCENNIEIIGYKSKNYPKKILNYLNAPFCILVQKGCNINLNNSFVYIFFDEYYSKSAKYIFKYHYNAIKRNCLNILSEKEEIEKVNLKLLDNYFLESNDKKKSIDYKNFVFFLDRNTLENFKICIVDFIDIIEARYDRYIVERINTYLDLGKQIAVVPNSIFNKNAYFSNYLIKQGADIILNISDLNFILNSLSC